MKLWWHHQGGVIPISSARCCWDCWQHWREVSCQDKCSIWLVIHFVNLLDLYYPGKFLQFVSNYLVWLRMSGMNHTELSSEWNGESWVIVLDWCNQIWLVVSHKGMTYVKVQDGWLVCVCSPMLIPRQLRFSLYSGAVITEGRYSLFTLYCSSCLDLVLCLMPGS